MKQNLRLFIDHRQEGTYFTLPFQMPPGVESLSLSYEYDRYMESETGPFMARQEVNIVDIGLIAPDGSQAGASGSDKKQVFLSETISTPGYHACPLVEGTWQILLGAYKVAPEGVNVTFELVMEEKSLRLLKGDLHAHTLASDGVHTVEELAWKAKRNGLDFLAITDHNQMISYDSLPGVPGLTLIPGIEWTHYQGHANFLGVSRPYDAPFATNSLPEARALFESARARGALITINHPFETCCVWRFGLDALPFDYLEIWNGPMRETNLRALGLWQSLLANGKKVPACGGSDYHHDTPFLFLGGPTTCVYAMSPSPKDILTALQQGHAYITFSPDGPALEFTAGDALTGDSVPLREVKEMHIAASGLIEGDVIRVVTGRDAVVIGQAPAAGSFRVTHPMKEPGFARVEVWRSFLPGLPQLPALLSNPIYFESSDPVPPIINLT